MEPLVVEFEVEVLGFMALEVDEVALLVVEAGFGVPLAEELIEMLKIR